MIIVDEYSYPYRLDLLLTKRDFKAVQDRFEECLKSSPTLEEAVNKFHEGNILPIAVSHNASIKNPKKIEDFQFCLLVDRFTPYGGYHGKRPSLR